MNKQVQIDLNFTSNADAMKTQIQSLMTSLNNLTTGTAAKNLPITPQIQQAQDAANQLKVALSQAVNVNTGKMDLSKFNTSLNSMGTNLDKLKTQLMSVGSQGQQAFMGLAQSIMSAEIPAKRTSATLTQLGATLKNTVKWQLSSSLIHGFVGGIKSAYGYAQDLNKSLNNIRIVTGYSADEMDRFALKANKAAKALSASTLDYTKASLIYYQQGLSDEQVKARTETTVKMANVTRQSAEVVSDQMTAIWNNFYDGSKSLEYYADVLTKLGAKTASSTDEIAGGLEKFAGVADTIGLSYEYAASALATITAETRMSEEVVGTALKTIFARIQGLKLGETLEDGVDLNKYSQALKSVDVDILDVNGQMKTMDIILDETAAKWETLSKAQQMALAQTVGGVRQYTQFVTLMDEWDTMQRNVDLAQNSEGELQNQADIYAESWEAAQKRVKSSAQGIYDSIINDDFFIDMTDGLAAFLELLEKFIDSMGGAKGLLMGISSLLLHTFSAQVATGLENMVYNIQSFFGITGKKALETKQLVNELTQSFEFSASASSLQSAQMTGMQSQYSLQKEILAVREKLTTEEQQLTQILLQQNQAYADQVTKAGSNVDSAKANMDSKMNMLRTEGFSHWSAEHTNNQIKSINKELDIGESIAKEMEEARQAFLSGKKDIEEYRAELDKLAQKASNAGLKDTSDFIKKQVHYKDKEGYVNSKTAKNRARIVSGEDVGAMVEKDVKSNAQHKFGKIIDNPKDIDAATDSVIKYRKSVKELDDAKVKLKDNTARTRESIQKLGNAGKRLSSQIVGVSQSMMSLGFAMSSLSSLGKTWADPSVKSGEKLIQTFMSLGMAIPMLMNSVTGLTRVLGVSKIIQDALTVSYNKNNLAIGQKIAGMTAEAYAEKNNMTIEQAHQSLIAMGMAQKLKELGITQSKIMSMSAEQLATKTGMTIDQAEIVISKMREGATLKEALAEAGLTAVLAKSKIGKLATAIAGKVLAAAKGTETAAVWANNAAWYANPVLWIAVIIIAVVAAIALLVVGIVKLTQALNSDANAAKEAAEKAKQLGEQYDKAKASYEAMIETIGNYKSGIEALDKLTQGTSEFNDKLREVNQNATNLIKKYPQLKRGVDWDYNSKGAIEFSSGVLEDLQKKESQELDRLLLAKNVGEAEASVAQTKADTTDLERQIRGENGVGNWDLTFKTAMLAGTSSIPGLTGAAMAQTGYLFNKANDYDKAIHEAVEQLENDPSFLERTNEEIAMALGIDVDSDIIDALRENSTELSELGDKLHAANQAEENAYEAFVRGAWADNKDFQNLSKEDQDKMVAMGVEDAKEDVAQKRKELEDQGWGTKNINTASTEKDQDAQKVFKEYMQAAGLETAKLIGVTGTDDNRKFVYEDENENPVEVDLETMMDTVATASLSIDDMALSADKAAAALKKIGDITYMGDETNLKDKKGNSVDVDDAAAIIQKYIKNQDLTQFTDKELNILRTTRGAFSNNSEMLSAFGITSSNYQTYGLTKDQWDKMTTSDGGIWDQVDTEKKGRQDKQKQIKQYYADNNVEIEEDYFKNKTGKEQTDELDVYKAAKRKQGEAALTVNFEETGGSEIPIGFAEHTLPTDKTYYIPSDLLARDSELADSADYLGSDYRKQMYVTGDQKRTEDANVVPGMEDFLNDYQRGDIIIRKDNGEMSEKEVQLFNQFVSPNLPNSSGADFIKGLNKDVGFNKDNYYIIKPGQELPYNSDSSLKLDLNKDSSIEEKKAYLMMNQKGHILDQGQADATEASNYKSLTKEVDNYQKALNNLTEDTMVDFEKAQKNLNKALLNTKWEKATKDIAGYMEDLVDATDLTEEETYELYQNIATSLSDATGKTINADWVGDNIDLIKKWYNSAGTEAQKYHAEIMALIAIENAKEPAKEAVDGDNEYEVNVKTKFDADGSGAIELIEWQNYLQQLLQQNPLLVDAKTGRVDISKLMNHLIEAGASADHIAAVMKALGQSHIEFSGDVEGDFELPTEIDFSDPEQAAEYMQTVIENWKSIQPKVKLLGAEVPDKEAINMKRFNGDDKNKGNKGNSKKPKKAKKENVDQQITHFKDSDNRLAAQEKIIDKITRKKDGLYGKKYINAIEEENKAIEKTNALLEDQYEEASRYKAQHYQELQNLGIHVELDPVTGEILNQEDIERQIAEWKNTKEETYTAKYNASGEDTDAAEEWKEQEEERIEAAEYAVDKYIEAWEKGEDIRIQQEENLLKIQENNLEIIQTKLESILQLREREIEFLEIQNQLLEDNYKKSPELYGNIFKMNANDLKALNDYRNAYDKAMSMNLTDAGRQEAVQEAYDGILDKVSSLIDRFNELKEAFSNTMDEWNDDMQFIYDQFDHFIGITESYEEIMGLLGRSTDYTALGNLYSAREAQSREKYLASVGEYDAKLKLIQEERAKLEDPGMTETARAIVEENIKKLTEEVHVAQDTMLQNAVAWGEALKTILHNTLQAAAKELEETLTGSTFDEINQQMEFTQAKQEDYLTNTNQQYETQKMIRTAQLAIEKTENEVARRKLELFKKETQELQNQEKLSKYQLDYQQASYEVLLAEIALQEAQNTKSQVRLQRDSEGNFNYVYTADENKIAEAQQQYEDAVNNRYNISLEAANEFAEKYKSTMEEYLNAVQEVIDDETLSTEQKNEKIEALTQEYYAQLLNYQELYGDASGDLGDRLNEAWTTDMMNNIASAEEFKTNTNTYVGEVQSAFTSFQGKINTLSGYVSGNFDDITEKAKTLAGQMQTTQTEGSSALQKLSLETAAWANSSEGDLLTILNYWLSIADVMGMVLDGMSGYANEVDYMAGFEKATTQREARAFLEGRQQKYTADPWYAEEYGENRVALMEETRDQSNQLIAANTVADALGAAARRQVKLDFLSPEDAARIIAESGTTWDMLVTKITTGLGVSMEEFLKTYDLTGWFEDIYQTATDSQFGGGKYMNDQILALLNEIKNTPNYFQHGSKKRMSSATFDTGGYTGDFGSEGKFAMLHEKELVLNADDTANLLDTIDIVRGLVDNIEYRALMQSFGRMSAPMVNLTNETLEQDVTIHAEFPNVQDKNEIEEAFNNLINTASQYANRKNR